MTSIGVAFARTAQRSEVMSIVRERAKGGLLALVPIRTVRRGELNFSFVYDGVGAVESSVDPV